MTNDGPMRFHISTAGFDGSKGIEEFRETFGRTILRLEMNPLNDTPLSLDMDVRVLPGFAMASGSMSPMQNSHPTELIDNDDVVLTIMKPGAGQLRQAGRETDICAGEGVLTANGEPATSAALMPSTVLNFRLSRSVLINDVVDLDDAVARVIPADNPALRLLLGYSSLLNDPQSFGTPELCRAFVTHMHDLAALALGAGRDAAATARLRGLRAARLQGIKSDIMENLTRSNLSIDAVALRQGLSRSYVSKLMASDGATFTDFVLDRRLAHAYRMLTNWRYAERKISEIALASGIGDLSYFNRTFRRRYGLTPSDVRARAWSSGDNS